MTAAPQFPPEDYESSYVRPAHDAATPEAIMADAVPKRLSAARSSLWLATDRGDHESAAQRAGVIDLWRAGWRPGELA
jgi:hypothetical protein